ncbi:MAG: hypothetical protein Q7W30_05100 [Coriobacteriia bacterium]|nr:hypothetical protein [Coriobacteriia bacterium]
MTLYTCHMCGTVFECPDSADRCPYCAAGFEQILPSTVPEMGADDVWMDGDCDEGQDG